MAPQEQERHQRLLSRGYACAISDSHIHLQIGILDHGSLFQARRSFDLYRFVVRWYFNFEWGKNNKNNSK